ncbi:MAG: glycoside hydrolase family 2 protein [Actinobacteria bacterium]|nr:glycoside hydrolase family 2 protein [Actinomycetota bacterium]
MPSSEPSTAPFGAVTVPGHECSELTAGWQVAACEPDACATPAAAAGLNWLPAEVPGTAAGALRAAGEWDFDAGRDFDAEDWWFRTGFDAAPAAGDEEVVLHLDGVATVHEVFLNGERIGGGESMFAPAAIDVGARLREGANELAIRCLALGPRLGARRKPRARWRTRLADNRLRFHRTMVLGRCPGFAAGPAAVGPWRPVWLERRRLLAVEEIALRPRCEGEDGILAVAATLRGLGGFEVAAAEVAVALGGEARSPLTVVPAADGTVELRGEVRVPAAPRWWPHTHGEPVLHTVRLRVTGSAGEVGIEAGRVGFRELAAGPTPGHDVLADGLDLHLNGVRVFARGAVWTPDDFVGLAPDGERLRAALERVRDAGMNMVRIPGTAAYETPAFHDLCDELGILVWQDFMFANFDYPIADEEFRAAVEAEARQVLAGIAGRPSLAVVCGNSEVEQQVAMLGLDPGLGRGELFGELLPAAVERSGADAAYVPSAPCGGARPFRPDHGVANYYGVGGYRRPLADARAAGVRFAAECLAFANVPDPAGVEAVLPAAPGDVVVHHPAWKAGVPRDAGTGWDFDDVRDHYLGELFGVDAVELRRYDHDRYLELSRAVSAEAMSAVFGEWRRAGSACGGGLVLWLRDLRPGAGWGLVDHAGAPKQALRALRGVLAPTAVWLTDEGLAGVGVHVANDAPEPLRARLRLSLYGEMEQPVGEVLEEIEVPGREGRSYDLEALLGRFVDASWSYRFGPPAQDAIVAALEVPPGGAEDPLAEAIHFPAGRPSAAESAERLGLEVVAEADGDGAVMLRLRSRKLVWGLHASGSGRVAEQPLIQVEPGRERRLRLLPDPRSGDPGPVSVRAVNLRGRMSVAIP